MGEFLTCQRWLRLAGLTAGEAVDRFFFCRVLRLSAAPFLSSLTKESRALSFCFCSAAGSDSGPACASGCFVYLVVPGSPSYSCSWCSAGLASSSVHFHSGACTSFRSRRKPSLASPEARSANRSRIGIFFHAGAGALGTVRC